MSDRRRPFRLPGSRSRSASFLACVIVVVLCVVHGRQPATAAIARPGPPMDARDAGTADTAGAAGADEADEVPPSLLPWGLTIGAELELAHERQAGSAADEFTFDELDLGWSGGWMEAEVGIKYDTDSGRGLRLEDASLRLNGGDRRPAFIELGRLVLPFGQFESRFIEDPLVAVTGEIDDEALVLGVVGDRGEFALGALKGEHGGAGDLDCVASLVIEPQESLGVGISWTRDLGESVELRELRAEREEDAAGTPSDAMTTPVAGLGFFAAFAGEPWSLLVECVAALASFAPGVLDEAKSKPSAWNLEAARRLNERWEAAVRFEAATGLPGAPKWQCGLAGTYAAAEFMSVTAEALHGHFSVESARELLSLRINLEF